jgi:hypothetical protein
VRHDCAGVVAVRDQGGTVEPLPGTRSQVRRDQVAGIPDGTGRGQRSEVIRRLRMNEAFEASIPATQAETKILTRALDRRVDEPVRVPVAVRVIVAMLD